MNLDVDTLIHDELRAIRRLEASGLSRYQALCAYRLEASRPAEPRYGNGATPALRRPSGRRSSRPAQ
jgi:hypothetical protein